MAQGGDGPQRHVEAAVSDGYRWMGFTPDIAPPSRRFIQTKGNTFGAVDNLTTGCQKLSLIVNNLGNLTKGTIGQKQYKQNYNTAEVLRDVFHTKYSIFRLN